MRYYSADDAFSNLVPTGMLGGDGLPGVVPVSVVNSLLVPSVLSVQSQWPNSDNSSSIWRPSEVKIAHFDVSGQCSAFCCLCVWKRRPCLEELPSAPVGVRWGRRVSFVFPPPLPITPLLLAVLPSPFWSRHQIYPGFYEWRLPKSNLGKWQAEEDVWENAPEQAINFDKTVFPVGEEEESKKVISVVDNGKCHERADISLIPAH